MPRSFEALPFGEIVAKGLADLEEGVESVEALLVSIGRPRLQTLGVDVPAAPADAEHRLYARLEREESDAAHGRYNALVRGLVSFERSLACVR